MFSIGVGTYASLGMIPNENSVSLHNVILGLNREFEIDPAKLITRRIR
jgi:hypothetical protein